MRGFQQRLRAGGGLRGVGYRAGASNPRRVEDVWSSSAAPPSRDACPTKRQQQQRLQRRVARARRRPGWLVQVSCADRQSTGRVSDKEMSGLSQHTDAHASTSASAIIRRIAARSSLLLKPFFQEAEWVLNGRLTNKAQLQIDSVLQN